MTIATWAASVAAGGAVGGVLQIPTAVASFAMTALFVYLLWSQLEGQGGEKTVAAVAAAAVVVGCKAVGWTEVAVPAGAVAGVVAAILWAGRNGSAEPVSPAAPAKGGDAQ